MSRAVIQATTVRTPDGRSLDVRLAGPEDGTALLFHYGTPGAGLPFEGHVAAAAARGLRFVTFSRPGYGSSTPKPGRTVGDVVPDAAAVLDDLGIDRAYVGGWSGGGPHALACAALMPGRILGTVVIAGVAPYPAEGLDWLAGMGAENVEEFGVTLEGREALERFMAPTWPTLRDVTPDAVAGSLGDLVDDVDRASVRAEFADWLAALFHEALREGPEGWYEDDLAFIEPWGFGLGSIPSPVHLWQGEHDRMVPFAHGRWLAAHVGAACTHLHTDHGHLTLVVDAFPAILDELIAPSSNGPR